MDKKEIESLIDYSIDKYVKKIDEKERKKRYEEKKDKDKKMVYTYIYAIIILAFMWYLYRMFSKLF